ncbi:hypothetical protein MHM98_18685 [Psychrobium sp. MM17-31]|uniref:hypothetical protein n=1 Tax=Psychrobium sp. MM17-31 TaxID=2917758 RepID=UPI001EF461B0|nr:hypothetical protein [Psychrobium sp. MM17-31]MCG7533359.1 hypothetical protein [Psychrobium sp. MM17-31]
MWPKSLIAIIGGCLLSISLMLNLNFIFPFEVDTRLFIGLLFSFPLWVGVMVWCYASDSFKHALKRCTALFIPSAMFNAFFLIG